VHHEVEEPRVEPSREGVETPRSPAEEERTEIEDEEEQMENVDTEMDSDTGGLAAPQSPEHPDFENVSRSFSDSVNPQDLMEDNWDRFYRECPNWCDTWEATQKPKGWIWPVCVKVFEGRMYLNEKLCIPGPLQKIVAARTTFNRRSHKW